MKTGFISDIFFNLAQVVFNLAQVALKPDPRAQAPGHADQGDGRWEPEIMAGQPTPPNVPPWEIRG